ncbi:MAG: RNA polymerase Rpb4 [Nitrososphaerales archaeon]
MKEKSRRTISISEVKQILTSLDPEKADQIQKRTVDYAEKSSTAKLTKVKHAVAEMVEKQYLSEEEALEVININPKSLPEMRVFTSGWKKLISTETLEKILGLVKEAYKQE